eukprot:1169140-Amphidinium_carterae.1
MAIGVSGSVPFASEALLPCSLKADSLQDKKWDRGRSCFDQDVILGNDSCHADRYTTVLAW